MTTADTAPTVVVASEPPASAVTVAHVVYALHGVALGIGAFSAASVVGMFLFGWPSIIAVVLAYVFRGDAKGTYLESHFDWQIRTFWLALTWAALIALVSAVLAIILVGFAIWIVGLFLLGIWASVRIVRGFMRLRDRRPMPM